MASKVDPLICPCGHWYSLHVDGTCKTCGCVRSSETTPARNVRKTEPRCCNTCAFLEFDNQGMAGCVRPDGPQFDVSLQEYLYMVCDLWRSQLFAPRSS